MPPSGSDNRTSAGTGSTPDEAAFRAMCEAAERYALQFKAGRNGILTPITVENGMAEGRDAAELCLGHPDHATDSKGCAAGDNRDDAIRRAAFEALEHQVIPDICTPHPDGIRIDPASVPQIMDLAAYLAKRQRITNIQLVVSPFGFCVCHVVLSDPDGSRRTFGRSCGMQIGSAAEKALHEAILSWRNMIELERNAVALPQTDPLVRHYRGLTRLERDVMRMDIQAAPSLCAATCSPLQMLAQVTGRRVQAFDMSVPEIAMPVVRVVVDPNT